MYLTMSNITDDKTERLLGFIRQIARFTTSREHEVDNSDAVDTLDCIIIDARTLLNGTD